MDRITKEQALEALERIEPVVARFGGGDLVRALDMVIRHIEQQPDSEPAIEREAWFYERFLTRLGWTEQLSFIEPQPSDYARNIRRVMVRDVEKGEGQ